MYLLMTYHYKSHAYMYIDKSSFVFQDISVRIMFGHNVDCGFPDKPILCSIGQVCR